MISGDDDILLLIRLNSKSWHENLLIDFEEGRLSFVGFVLVVLVGDVDFFALIFRICKTCWLRVVSSLCIMDNVYTLIQYCVSNYSTSRMYIVNSNVSSTNQITRLVVSKLTVFSRFFLLTIIRHYLHHSNNSLIGLAYFFTNCSREEFLVDAAGLGCKTHRFNSKYINFPRYFNCIFVVISLINHYLSKETI